MDLLGKNVENNKYGVGIIISQTDSYLSVKFMTEDEVKKFPYPICFKSFLRLIDEESTVEIDAKIKQHEEVEAFKKNEARKAAEAQAFTRRMQTPGNVAARPVSVRPSGSVKEFCDEYKLALSNEIAYLKVNGGKRQRIFDGKMIEFNNERIIYTFEAEDEMNYPDGTPISIWVNQDSKPGIILGCEEFTIIIATTYKLGVEVEVIEFSAEPWRLLISLIERLDEMQERHSDIVKDIICNGYKAVDSSNAAIVTGQQAAIKMSHTEPITFIWGPPGTGKTESLAKIARSHITKGHRVLMLSHSNVSVDGAIMRVHSMAEASKPGALVRYGYARRKDLLDHEFLTSYNLVLHNHPMLNAERKNLLSELKSTTRSTSRYVAIRNRLSEIRKSISEAEKLAVTKANFVATTVSKAVVDGVVRSGDFDVVIFDEASMAYIPQIVFSASLAKSHFICIGDFRQLPPIVQSSNTSLLNADIFQYCGITAAVDGRHNHKWLCMLDTQYRMQPEIADFASFNMYGGRLKSAENMLRERQNIVLEGPVAGHAIGFFDLSGMMSVCNKTSDGSRINVLSALLSFSLALKAANRYEVGIITPYHAQSRLLHAMSRDISEMNPELKAISCATVHQFQGSEKDIVIFDAVDCYRMPYPGMLLTATGNNYANRLFNVALTRARGKFVGVANVSYLDNKNLSNGLMFKKMIERQRRRSGYIRGEQLIIGQDSISGSSMSFFDPTVGNDNFFMDIAQAKFEILIDIPGRLLDSGALVKLSEILKHAKSKGIKVIIRAESKGNLPSVVRPLAIENTFVVNPLVLIDKQIIWFGEPLSEAQFVSEGVTLPTRFRPIIRFVGQHTAKALYGYSQMNRTADQSTKIEVDRLGTPITDTFASYVLANKKCPSCGKEMRLQKSRNGKFFLACIGYPSCKETDLVDINIVDKYLLSHGSNGQRCIKCNSLLEAKNGRYGLYIQCCGPARHKYKLDDI